MYIIYTYVMYTCMFVCIYIKKLMNAKYKEKIMEYARER